MNGVTTSNGAMSCSLKTLGLLAVCETAVDWSMHLNRPSYVPVRVNFDSVQTAVPAHKASVPQSFPNNRERY